MSLSISLTKEEEILFNDYAKTCGLKLSEALKRALLEKIEDMEDLKIAEEAYQEYLKDGKKTYPIEELWEELGL